jgi:membrane protease YdiL (CAAX protease family)
MFNRTDFRGTWGLKGPIAILAVYSCVLFPALHILFPQAQKWAPTIYPTYFGVMVVFLVFTRYVTWQQLGFHKEHWKQNLILGCLAGGLLVGAVPLLDLLIDATGMGQTELFSGAGHRLSQELEGNASFIAFIVPTIFIALAEQGFLTGYVLQALIRKSKPALAVYLGGLIFALVHFDLQLGMFLLGLIASSFYWLTGSLVAPLIFQIACHTAGWLLVHNHPKVFTLLGFLF